MTNQNPSWQQLFTAAMLELDAAQLGARINVAIAAIEQRQRALALQAQVGEVDEVPQLRDAALTLRSLQRMEIGSPSELQPEQSLEGVSL